MIRKPPTDGKPPFVHSQRQERAEARKAAAEAEARYSAIFSAEAVDRIVEAVAKTAAIPEKLDRGKLGRDLDRAVFWLRRFEDVALSQPWTGIQQHGKKLIKAAQAFTDLWMQDSDGGRWWRDQVAPYLDLAKATAGFEGLIAKLMSERFTASKEPMDEQQPGKWPLRWLLERDGPESVLEWWLGEHLAILFEHHFNMPAKVKQSRSISKDGEVVAVRGPYIAFALAVLQDAGVGNADGSPIKATSILQFRRREMRKSRK
ncbi:hypothetical protein [Mesorhizobium ciceri]|nr:hypothetical protein [Mesorhizobium ciceri]